MGSFFRSFKNSFAMIASKLVMQLAGMALVMVIARKLSVTDYGQYALVMSIYFGFQFLALLGYDNYLTKELAQKPTEQNHLFVTSAVWKVALTTLVIPLCWGFARIMQYPPGTILAVTIISFALVPDTLSMIMDSAFLAAQKIVYVSILLIAVNVGRVIVGIGLLLLGYGVLPLIAVFVLFQTAYMVMEFVLYTRYIGHPRFEFDWTLSKQMFVKSLPFAVIGIISTVFVRTDVILISKLHGEDGVGLYSAAYKLMQIGWIVLSTFILSLYPGMCKAYVFQREQFCFGVEKLIQAILVALLPVVVVLGLLGRQALTIVYSAKYVGAASVYAVLLYFLIPFAVDQVFVRVLFALGRQRSNLPALAVGTITNLIGCFLLIPNFGFFGAGISLLCSMFVILSIDYLFVARFVGVSMMRIGLKPGLATALMGLTVMLLRDSHVGVTVATSLSIYLVSVLLLGVFARDDIRFLRQMLAPSPQ